MSRIFYTNAAKRTAALCTLAAATAKLRASVLLLTECHQGMARQIAQARGWSDLERQSWVGLFDEHVIWNPGRYRFVDALSYSLSTEPGDWADLRRRAVVWALLQRRDNGELRWFGVSHLSHTGDQSRTLARSARIAQAHRLLAGAPDDGVPVLLGIDRNSGPKAAPAKTLAPTLPLLTPDLRDTFRGNGFQAPAAPIDGLHGTANVADYWQVLLPDITDHTGILAVVR